MADESRLQELMTRWQNERACGHDVAVTELCHDCPELAAELARRIAAVRQKGIANSADLTAPMRPCEPGTGRRPETAWHAGPAPEPNELPTHSLADRGRSATPATDSRPPEDRGQRYRPIRLHRTGGLGQVWLARDGVLGRDVALKELRADRVGDSRLRTRFLQEARITGQLEHPSIVPLYDLLDDMDEAGDAENPRYTMRFVAGRTLAEATQDFHRRRREGGATALDLSALLDAFVAVCHAIAYAHSRKVLHRDVKGSNIVLGDFGEVFVLDWGLAKVIGEPDASAEPGASAESIRASQPPEVTWIAPSRGNVGTGGVVSASPSPMATPDGAVLGTPAYMAPELAEGQPASTASDIYALGVLLYVLLTGHLPYEGQSTLEVLEKIRAGDPPRPRTLNPSAPPALAAVCRRAMARRPEDRYANAEDLAADVRRWRADEPVAAHAESWPARFARWARRHRTAVAAVAVFLVSAVAALSIATVLVWRGERRTQVERARAERNFNTARTLILDMSNRIQALETGRDTPRQTDLARQAALEKAREAFDQFRADQPEDVWVQRQAADVHRFAANVSRLLNDYASAEKAYAASLGIWEDLIRQFPDDPKYRDNLAQTLRDKAMFQKRLGRLSEATVTIDRAKTLVDDMERELPPSSYQRTLGITVLDRAELEYLLGRFDAAEQSARQALDLLDRLKDATDAQPHDRLFAAAAVHYTAMAQRERGNTDDALASHDDAVGRVRALLGPKPSRGLVFWDQETRRERARTWARVADRRAAAVEDLAEVIKGAEQMVEDYPLDPLYGDGLAASYLRRGELHLLGGQFGLAAADLEKSLLLSKQLLTRYGNQSAYLGTRGQTYLTLGRVFVAQGKPAEAEDRLKKAATVFKIGLQQDPDNVHHRRALDQAEREAAPR